MSQRVQDSAYRHWLISTHALRGSDKSADGAADGAVLAWHLRYEPHGAPKEKQANRGNHVSSKILKDIDGGIVIPRDY